MVPIHTNFNIRKVFSLLSHTYNFDLKYWQPPIGSHPHKIQHYKSVLFIKSNTKYWQPPNGSHPHKLQHYSILLIHSDTKYIFQKIFATPKWFPSTQTPAVQKCYLYQVNIDVEIMATSTLTQK